MDLSEHENENIDDHVEHAFKKTPDDDQSNWIWFWICIRDR